jgi:hypothetical protein
MRASSHQTTPRKRTPKRGHLPTRLVPPGRVGTSDSHATGCLTPDDLLAEMIPI